MRMVWLIHISKKLPLHKIWNQRNYLSINGWVEIYLCFRKLSLKFSQSVVEGVDGTDVKAQSKGHINVSFVWSLRLICWILVSENSCGRILKTSKQFRPSSVLANHAHNDFLILLWESKFTDSYISLSLLFYHVIVFIILQVDEVTNPDGAWSGSQPSDHFLSGSAGAACSQSSAPSIPPVQSLGPCVTSPHQAVVNISARKSTDVHSSSQSSIHHGITKFMNKIKSSVPFVNARAFNWNKE